MYIRNLFYTLDVKEFLAQFNFDTDYSMKAYKMNSIQGLKVVI